MKLSATAVIIDLGEAILASLADAKEQAVLVAPFISRLAFDHLMKATPEAAAVEVITRWRVDEVAAGVSDTSILDYEELRVGFSVWLLPMLHAKLYLVDGQVAFVGSANLTGLGLGFNAPANVEVTARLEPAPTMLQAFVYQLKRNAVRATAEIRQQVEAEANLRREDFTRIPIVAYEHEQTGAAIGGELWLPSFRFPNRLYEAYRSLQDLSVDAKEAALLDLSYISCKDGLTSDEFHLAVRGWLLEQPVVRTLDPVLLRSRRFGELVDWLRRYSPTSFQTRDAAKRKLQTLLRWLVFFAGDRYHVAQQRFSEILSRVS
jgi:hypothetical protein